MHSSYQALPAVHAHKFVAIDHKSMGSVTRPDLSALDPARYNELMALYPRVGENDRCSLLPNERSTVWSLVRFRSVWQ
jgi:hypothetical protein